MAGAGDVTFAHATTIGHQEGEPINRFLVIVSIVGVVASAARARQASPVECVQAAPFDGARRYVVTSTTNKTRYQIDVLRMNSTVAPVPDSDVMRFRRSLEYRELLGPHTPVRPARNAVKRAAEEINR